MRLLVLSACVLAGLDVPASAALLLDFGPTTPEGASLTNSRYHVATGATDSTWNVVGITDVASLFNSDGTAATGLSLNLGASAVSTTLIDLANQPDSSLALGTSTNTGVYAG